MQSSPAAYERYPGAAARPLSPSYRSREPEKTVLYDIVSRNLKTCLEQAQELSEHGYGYPRFVEREFEKFLECGLLRRGFVRLKCSECPNEKLVAFSCKGRGFCPSCTARRMANTAAHLVDRVLPEVAYRQWVISFPRRVRFLLARDHDLLSEVLAASLRKIFAWQKRRARRLSIDAPMCGAVSFVQRFGSLLTLNCHFHILVPDGVFFDDDGQVEFCPIPPPTANDVARLVAQIARVTEKRIQRRLESETSDEPPDLLAIEQARSLEATRFPSSAPWGQTDELSQRRCAFLYGYSLHAERRIAPDDRDGLERLCRYGARAPVANSRLSLNDVGDAVVALKRPLRDGRTQLTFTPVELLRKLAILIPPPRKNLTRYHGIWGPAHRYRSAIIPSSGIANANADSGPASSRICWAELLRRTFAIDILRCDQCGGSMKILAVIPESDSSERILDHLGIGDPEPRAVGPPSA